MELNHYHGVKVRPLVSKGQESGPRNPIRHNGQVPHFCKSLAPVPLTVPTRVQGWSRSLSNKTLNTCFSHNQKDVLGVDSSAYHTSTTSSNRLLPGLGLLHLNSRTLSWGVDFGPGGTRRLNVPR